MPSPQHFTGPWPQRKGLTCVSLLVAAAGVALDQWSKVLVVRQLSLGQVKQALPGLLQWRRVENTGAAFNLFDGGVWWLGIISWVVSLGLVLWLLKRPPRRPLSAVAYGLVLAGAVGNGLDRWFRGAVVDWIDLMFISFPVFNLADVSINLAVLLLVLDALLPTRKP